MPLYGGSAAQGQTFQTMKLLTIQDPACVRDTLQTLYPDALAWHAYYDHRGWNAAIVRSGEYSDPTGNGKSPQDAIDDLKARLAARDPFAHLQSQAEKLGYTLNKIEP